MPTLNPNLKPFWKARKLPSGDNVIGRVLYGGRMSSKSHDMAGVAIARANFKEERFLCTRMYQNRIADSVYTLLKDKISYFGLEDNFKVFADAIEHKTNGSLFRFYGVARSVDEIKSFEKATVWWNEESHNLTEDMFTIIRPTVMRNENAEMWFTLNPRLISDYSYQRLIEKPPKGFLVRKINYDENPFLPTQALKDINNEFEEDQELAEHIYLGIPRSDDDAAIIKLSWVEAAIDAHLKLDIDLTGAKTVGYDVADDGGDRNCSIAFNGSIAQTLEAWKAGEDELGQSALRAWSMAGNEGSLVYDAIGNGAHVGSKLSEIEGTDGRYFKFIAGGAVINPDDEYAPGIINKDKFENLKAQAWIDVADRLRNTYNAVTKGHEYEPDKLISICSDIDQLSVLKTELCMPHRSYSARGLDMVEKKDKLKKRIGKSPDLADAFIMGACPHLTHTRSSSLWDFDLESEDWETTGVEYGYQ